MFLQCKNCPYFDTVPEKMKWGICTKHWDKEDKPNERNV